MPSQREFVDPEYRARLWLAIEDYCRCQRKPTDQRTIEEMKSVVNRAIDDLVDKAVEMDRIETAAWVMR